MTTAKRRSKDRTTGESAIDGYRADLWRMADALRGSMDAADYKHVVLGLIFLKYISDAFEELHSKLEDERNQGAEPENRDEYLAEDIFWVPPEARWWNIQSQARQPTIGQVVDSAMIVMERENPVLREVLPKDYAREALDKQRLGRVIDLVSGINLGGAEARTTDVLGHVYEYFLEQFALAEGRKGGEFYTPRSVVGLLVEMLEPYQGRVYDPCCGAAGMFVKSVDFVRAHTTGNGNGGKARGDLSIYGQESNYTTWRLAKMNLAIRGLEGQISHGDSRNPTIEPPMWSTLPPPFTDRRSYKLPSFPRTRESREGGRKGEDDLAHPVNRRVIRYHISMTSLNKNTPNPPVAHATVHRNNSPIFSASRAALNDSTTFLYIRVSPSFLAAMLAALVTTAAISGNAISPTKVSNPSFSSAAPNNTAAIAVALIKISAMTVVATNLRPVTAKYISVAGQTPAKAASASCISVWYLYNADHGS